MNQREEAVIRKPWVKPELTILSINQTLEGSTPEDDGFGGGAS